ncbi:MAG TPA: rhodanese-like domain-containing protein, partial [Candidatus Glassbacteria bacterium]|nr:rhodanese-like domain-containing protein [Candidatus Glassbacteria bacterium]
MRISFGNPFIRSLLLVAAAALAGITFNFFGGIPLVAPQAALPADSRGSELPVQDGIYLVDLAAARKFIDEARSGVVDARSPSEYAAGHLPGALNCHVYELEVYLPELLNRTSLVKPLLLYCGAADCEDSRFLAETLLELGYKRLYVYEGGFAQWSALGLPVERGGGVAAGRTARLTIKRILDFSSYLPSWVWHVGEVLLLAVGVFVLMLIANG